MRLLIDTHIVLWRMTANPRLSAQAIELLDAAENLLEVSVVSIWEVAVKHALPGNGRQVMPVSGKTFLRDVRAVGIEPLSITAEHAAEVDRLPLVHRDPFDRLLVAQARSESMHLLTHDKALAAYGDFVLVV